MLVRGGGGEKGCAGGGGGHVLILHRTDADVDGGDGVVGGGGRGGDCSGDCSSGGGGDGGGCGVGFSFFFRRVGGSDYPGILRLGTRQWELPRHPSPWHASACPFSEKE